MLRKIQKHSIDSSSWMSTCINFETRPDSKAPTPARAKGRRCLTRGSGGLFADRSELSISYFWPCLKDDSGDLICEPLINTCDAGRL